MLKITYVLSLFFTYILAHYNISSQEQGLLFVSLCESQESNNKHSTISLINNLKSSKVN